MKRNLTCIGVNKGVIGVINEYANIEHYSLRGIKKLSASEQCCAVESGIISVRALRLPELPKDVSLVWECKEMKSRITFDKKWLYE